MLNNQNDPTIIYSQFYHQKHHCCLTTMKSNDSYVHISDIVGINLTNYVHEREQLVFVPSVDFLPSYSYLCVSIYWKMSHWNPDALKSKKCSP